MRFSPIARWKRWRARRGGVHRTGAERHGTDAHPALRAELDAARRRLADVNALGPRVDRLSARIQVTINRNHLGPLFDEALGLGPRLGHPRGGRT
jgi:hypothetical protein